MGGFKWEAVGLYEVLTTCGLPRRENTERAFSAESRHIPSENKSLGKLPWLILGERTNDHKRAFPNTFRDLAFAISAPLLFHCYMYVCTLASTSLYSMPSTKFSVCVSVRAYLLTLETDQGRSTLGVIEIKQSQVAQG